MKHKTYEIPDTFPNVKSMLNRIPKELRYIFMPDSEDGLAMLEADILAQKKRDKERKKVMVLQRLCGCMLRPNQSLRDVIMQAKKPDFPKMNSPEIPGRTTPIHDSSSLIRSGRRLTTHHRIKQII